MQALKAGGYAEDPNFVQSIGKMRNTVGKVAGTLGGQYTWNGQPTTLRFPCSRPKWRKISFRYDSAGPSR